MEKGSGLEQQHPGSQYPFGAATLGRKSWKKSGVDPCGTGRLDGVYMFFEMP